MGDFMIFLMAFISGGFIGSVVYDSYKKNAQQRERDKVESLFKKRYEDTGCILDCDEIPGDPEEFRGRRGWF